MIFADADSFLQRIATLPEPDYDAQPPVELAWLMRASAVTQPAPEHPATRIENRSIDGPNGSIPLRIYWPSGDGPFGVCVNLHGGGWVTGSIDGDDYRNQELVHLSGCAMVAVSYRLAPEYPFPAGLEDAYAATCWVANSASKLGFDAQRVAISGSSAGGNLAAAVTLMARDRKGPPLRAQILTYPICDDDFGRPSYLQNARGYLLTRARMKWFWDQYVAPDRRSNPYVAPIKGELDGLPPAHILTASLDPLCDEGEAYAESLKRAGVDVTLIRYDGAIHGFLAVNPKMPLSRRALAETAEAIQRLVLA